MGSNIDEVPGWTAPPFASGLHIRTCQGHCQSLGALHHPKLLDEMQAGRCNSPIASSCKALLQFLQRFCGRTASELLCASHLYFPNSYSSAVFTLTSPFPPPSKSEWLNYKAGWGEIHSLDRSDEAPSHRPFCSIPQNSPGCDALLLEDISTMQGRSALNHQDFSWAVSSLSKTTVNSTHTSPLCPGEGRGRH